MNSSEHRTPESILRQLSVSEKANLTHGRFLSGGIPRLGIPQLEVADGPVGIRLMGTKPVAPASADDEVEDTGTEAAAPARVTALPATILLASTWNRDSAREYAAVIAGEMLRLKKNVLLAPGVNLMRDPRGGRNFEYFGEDPFLTAEMAIGYVRGLQDRRVGANLKHFVANECDRSRHYTTSNVDSTTLREIYAYPFERAIREADAWSLMTGNNLVNGTYVSENTRLLVDLLRKRFGFDGVILTDWRSAYRAYESAVAGVDMTTGLCSYVYGDGDLERLVEEGVLSESELDATARRILTLYDRTGVLDPACREDGEVDTPRHRAIAKRIATEGMVLLRNEDNVLPLSSRVKLLVTGPGAASVEAGTGSGLVNGGVGNTPIIEGTTEAFGEASLHHVAHSASIEAQDIDEETTILYCAVAHTGREGNDLDEIVLPGDQPDEIRRLGSLNGSLVVVLQTGSAVDVSGWHEATDALLVCWYGGQATGEAVADILVGKTNPSGKLPCTFGNPIDDYPAAALGTWPARLLLDEEPSPPGRTKEDREQICAYAADYTEGTLIGYRWFTARGLTPVYPFGFGLSYTSFEYQEANVQPTADSAPSEAASPRDSAPSEGPATRDPATKAGPADGYHREKAAATDETSDSSDEGGWEVICRVKNTGTRAGDTVVQCYHRPPDSAVGRATAGVRPHELRGFCKVRIEPGESRNVVLHLRPNDLSRYDEVADAWVVSAGDHILRIGSSSTDLPFSLRISIEESTTVDSP